MRGFYVGQLLVGFVMLTGAESALAAIAGLERVASGLNLPTFVTHAPNDPSRLFVTEKPGVIKIIDLGSNTVSGTFLTIPDVDQTPSNEGGLLGLAFHPNYSREGEVGFGKFYVYVTVENSIAEGTSPFSSHVREYSVDPTNPNLADVTSKREILNFTQPQDNHNAGWIGFNPKVTPDQPQYLYIASGDGGGSFDNGGGHTAGTGNAQDITNNLLGKMLRIDVNGDDFTDDTPDHDNRNYAIPPTNPFVGAAGDDEIWSYGLRNPYRNSFDRLTGDLWIGDVGQDQREEIDFQPADSPGGENYGWRPREGSVMTGGGVGGPDSDEYTDPIYDYTRGNGAYQGRAVNGGYVYRGPDPDLQGLYFFSDSQVRNVWSLQPGEPISTPTNPTNINSQLGAQFSNVNVMVSMGEDALGNLYIVDYTTGGFPPAQNVGEVYRIVTDNWLDGDYNRDGLVDAADYTVWRNNLGTDFENADGDGSGTVDEGDYAVWRDHYGDSVHDFGAGSGGLSPVPEPATVTMLGTLSMLALLARGRRAKM